MKTKEQVLRYISQCEFSDEDWQKVLDYCREKYGGGKAHRALKPLPNSKSTYQSFLEWIDSGFGVGDVVRCGHTLGIVGAYTTGCARLAAYLSLDGRFIDNTIEFSKDKIYKADESEVALVKRELILHSLEFSVSLSCCVKAYQPNGGDFVRVTKGSVRTTAIFRSNDGEVVYFYAYVDGDAIVKDKECRVEDISMSNPTKTDIQRILMVMAKNKLEWLPRKRMLCCIELSRALKGGRYWYCTERFTICSDVDKYIKIHNERYKSGNYFVSYQEAILFLQKVHDLRKEIAGTDCPFQL